MLMGIKGGKQSSDLRQCDTCPRKFHISEPERIARIHTRAICMQAKQSWAKVRGCRMRLWDNLVAPNKIEASSAVAPRLTEGQSGYSRTTFFNTLSPLRPLLLSKCSGW